MKEAAEKPVQAKATRIGRYLVADPRICHGKVTIKGTRVMAWQIFEALARGEPAASIAANYRGVSEAAVAECVKVARRALLDADGRPLNGNGRRRR